jgi:hypothetical protein
MYFKSWVNGSENIIESQPIGLVGNRFLLSEEVKTKLPARGPAAVWLFEV